jgi:hypothetical protein
MKSLYKIIIAKEFAELGANKSFIMECTGIKRTQAENIIKEFGIGASNGERILIGEGFLSDANSRKEAELWWCTFERLDSQPKEERMLSAYKLYRQLSSSPISINKCLGINKAIENGVYEVSENEQRTVKLLASKSTEKLTKDDIEKNKDEIHKLFDAQFLFS